MVDETLARTNLGDFPPGIGVNLERPGAAERPPRWPSGPGPRRRRRRDRHAGAGPARSARRAGLLRYIIEKGSITVDGCSLTVVEPLADGFTVAVIPHTAEVTTLGAKGPGDGVNLEVDMMAKYIERLLEERG